MRAYWNTLINYFLIAFFVLLLTGCTNHNIGKISDTEIKNDYIGVSFTVPDNYYLQKANGYSRSSSELIQFTDRTADRTLTVRMEYEKFDKDTYTASGWGEFKQLPSLELIPSVIAMPPPIRHTITDMQSITINSVDYYTYSVEFDGKRQDVFIYPKEDIYCQFTFYDQDKDSIRSIMNSVKFTKSAYIDVFSLGKPINNTAIGLSNVNVPLEWEYSNSDESTILSYSGDLEYFKMAIASQDNSEIFNYMKSRCDLYPQEWLQGKVNTFDEDKAYLKSNFGCEDVDYGAIVKKRKALYCYMPENSEGKYIVYAYMGGLNLFVKTEYSGQTDTLKLYYNLILDSMGFTNSVG